MSFDTKVEVVVAVQSTLLHWPNSFPTAEVPTVNSCAVFSVLFVFFLYCFSVLFVVLYCLLVQCVNFTSSTVAFQQQQSSCRQKLCCLLFGQFCPCAVQCGSRPQPCSSKSIEKATGIQCNQCNQCNQCGNGNGNSHSKSSYLVWEFCPRAVRVPPDPSPAAETSNKSIATSHLFTMWTQVGTHIARKWEHT